LSSLVPPGKTPERCQKLVPYLLHFYSSLSPVIHSFDCVEFQLQATLLNKLQNKQIYLECCLHVEPKSPPVICKIGTCIASNLVAQMNCSSVTNQYSSKPVVPNMCAERFCQQNLCSSNK
jgi:hypothetical protein